MMLIKRIFYSYAPPVSITPESEPETPENDNQLDETYKNLLIDLYKQNQDFLNKGILAISSLAIPFLFTGAANPDINLYSKIIFTISLFGFFIVVFLQILSLKNARNGCDDALSNELDIRSQSWDKFKKARLQDIWREWIFLASLFLIIPAFLVNIIFMENKMSDSENKVYRVQMIDNTKSEAASYMPPKSMQNPKEMQNSYTPPQSVEKSFTPPTSMTIQNQPQASGGAGNNESAPTNNGSKK